MFTPAEYEAFNERYLSSRINRGPSERAVNQTDRDILADYTNGSKITQLSKKYNVSINKIRTSILLAVKG